MTQEPKMNINMAAIIPPDLRTQLDDYLNTRSSVDFHANLPSLLQVVINCINFLVILFVIAFFLCLFLKKKSNFRLVILLVQSIIQRLWMQLLYMWECAQFKQFMRNSSVSRWQQSRTQQIWIFFRIWQWACALKVD